MLQYPQTRHKRLLFRQCAKIHGRGCEGPGGAVSLGAQSRPFRAGESAPAGSWGKAGRFGWSRASHALSLGKVLVAGSEPGGAREYAGSFGLEVFTPRTIVRPDLFEVHLRAICDRGFATDVEEFAENLCCVAAPILGK